MSWLRKLLRMAPAAPRDGDRLPDETAHLPRDRAIALAEAEAERQNAPWRPPIEADLILDSGRPRWQVRSNWGVRGAGVSVIVDDETGEVVGRTVRPR